MTTAALRYHIHRVRTYVVPAYRDLGAPGLVEALVIAGDCDLAERAMMRDDRIVMANQLARLANLHPNIGTVRPSDTDRTDGRTRSRPVPLRETAVNDCFSEGFSGEPCRIRTCDPLIKS